jgi:hypothetical protein
MVGESGGKAASTGRLPKTKSKHKNAGKKVSISRRFAPSLDSELCIRADE